MHAAHEAHPAPIPSTEHVRGLVEANRVEEARRYVDERLAQGGSTLEQWARLLHPPPVTTSSYRPRRDFAADYRWLRENRETYLGRWVALRGGNLLDADVALKALVDRLTEHGLAEGTFVVQVG